MDNRNRDKMSKESTSPTSAGDVNRKTSQSQSDSSVEFGQGIGRSEDIENEPSRRSSGSLGSSSGSSSSGSVSSKRSSSSSGSSDSGWQSSSGRRSNLGEQSGMESSSSSRQSSDRSYGEGDKRGEH